MIEGLAIGVAIAVTMPAFTAETSARTGCFRAEHTRARRLMRGNLDGDGTKDAAWVERVQARWFACALRGQGAGSTARVIDG